jgi:hypothetical protein
MQTFIHSASAPKPSPLPLVVSKSNFVCEKGPGHTEITLRGIIFDTITELGLEGKAGSYFQDWKAIARWQYDSRHLLETSYFVRRKYPTERERLDNFSRLMVAYLLDFRGKATEYFEAYAHQDASEPETNSFAQEDNSIFNPRTTFTPSQRMFDHCKAVMYLATDLRKLCVSEKGYMGLVMDAVETGDQICIVIGCPVPVVLRPSKTDEDRFTIIRDMFLLDMMHGEALQTPGLEERSIILR